MSAAQMIPDLQGTGLDTGPQPVWIKTSAKVSVLVHPSYLMRAHTKAELSALVTQNGEPISQSGETLTIGLVPPWRRYAIGPVIDGKAEILAQHDFEREDKTVYVDTFRFRGERLDDPDKRPIPNVRNFVSVKIDSRASGAYPRLCPLGTHMAPEKPIQGAMVYDPAKDAMTARQVDEVKSALEAENASQKKRLEELEAKVNALVGRAPEPVAAAGPQSTSKCGKWTGKTSYLHMHESRCKKCKEA